MTDHIDPAVRALLEGKNAELKRMHLDVRIGDYQGSRVVSVREVIDQWAPEPGTSLEALWQQVKNATELYTDEIARIQAEAQRDIPGIADPKERPAFTPPVHYRRSDGVLTCVHAIPVGPDSCEYCRELAADDETEPTAR